MSASLARGRRRISRCRNAAARTAARVEGKSQDNERYWYACARLFPVPLTNLGTNHSLDDAIDDTVSSVLSKDNSAVLIYITTPPAWTTLNEQDGHLYEMDDPYPSAPHTDLKRDLGLHARQSGENDMQAGLPLFEKYQFLSPRKYLSHPIYLGRR